MNERGKAGAEFLSTNGKAEARIVRRNGANYLMEIRNVGGKQWREFELPAWYLDRPTCGWQLKGREEDGA